jgi:hypothetical protein
MRFGAKLDMFGATLNSSEPSSHVVMTIVLIVMTIVLIVMSTVLIVKTIVLIVLIIVLISSSISGCHKISVDIMQYLRISYNILGYHAVS